MECWKTRVNKQPNAINIFWRPASGEAALEKPVLNADSQVGRARMYVAVHLKLFCGKNGLNRFGAKEGHCLGVLQTC